MIGTPFLEAPAEMGSGPREPFCPQACGGLSRSVSRIWMISGAWFVATLAAAREGSPAPLWSGH